ncbi:hypothetical protein HYV81_02270 [Candidatus Woesearchaeota archaeon]|nr:hypothetical protein [Candidatus Woesearchaeota archaeon]
MKRNTTFGIVLLGLLLVLAGCDQAADGDNLTADTGGATTDTGAIDTGVTDTGITDTGVTDIGVTDTATTDTGTTDTGMNDTGTTSTVESPETPLEILIVEHVRLEAEAGAAVLNGNDTETVTDELERNINQIADLIANYSDISESEFVSAWQMHENVVDDYAIEVDAGRDLSTLDDEIEEAADAMEDVFGDMNLSNSTGMGMYREHMFLMLNVINATAEGDSTASLAEAEEHARDMARAWAETLGISAMTTSEVSSTSSTGSTDTGTTDTGSTY